MAINAGIDFLLQSAGPVRSEGHVSRFNAAG